MKLPGYKSLNHSCQKGNFRSKFLKVDLKNKVSYWPFFFPVISIGGARWLSHGLKPKRPTPVVVSPTPLQHAIAPAGIKDNTNYLRFCAGNLWKPEKMGQVMGANWDRFAQPLCLGGHPRAEAIEINETGQATTLSATKYFLRRKAIT